MGMLITDKLDLLSVAVYTCRNNNSRWTNRFKAENEMKTAINLALIFSCSPSVNDGGEKKKKKNLHPFTQKNGEKKKKKELIQVLNNLHQEIY